ncbi:MAG: YciI family protein [Planktomarina sp.]
MAKFLITYLGQPAINTPEEGKAHMAAWMAWMNGLGDALVHPATPLRASKTVGPDGASDGGVPVTGFLIVEAADMDAAVAISKSDPFTKHAIAGVSEMMSMPG